MPCRTGEVEWIRERKRVNTGVRSQADKRGDQVYKEAGGSIRKFYPAFEEKL